MERPWAPPSEGPLCPVLCVCVRKSPCRPHASTESMGPCRHPDFQLAQHVWGVAVLAVSRELASTVGLLGGGSERWRCSSRPAVGKSIQSVVGTLPAREQPSACFRPSTWPACPHPAAARRDRLEGAQAQCGLCWGRRGSLLGKRGPCLCPVDTAPRSTCPPHVGAWR